MACKPVARQFFTRLMRSTLAISFLITCSIFSMDCRASSTYNPVSPAFPYITDIRLLVPFPWDTELVTITPNGKKDLETVLDLQFFSSEHELVLKDQTEIPPDRPWMGVHASNGLFRLHTVFPHTEYQVAFAETNATFLSVIGS